MTDLTNDHNKFHLMLTHLILNKVAASLLVMLWQEQRTRDDVDLFKHFSEESTEHL